MIHLGARIKKIAVNLFIYLAYFLIVIFFEAWCAVTIIWFVDYKFSLNIWITVCALIVLALHYWLLLCLTKHKAIAHRTSRALLFGEILICGCSMLGCCYLMVYVTSFMECVQLLYIIAMNAGILLTRIFVNRYLRRA